MGDGTRIAATTSRVGRTTGAGGPTHEAERVAEAFRDVCTKPAVDYDKLCGGGRAAFAVAGLGAFPTPVVYRLVSYANQQGKSVPQDCPEITDPEDPGRPLPDTCVDEEGRPIGGIRDILYFLKQLLGDLEGVETALRGKVLASGAPGGGPEQEGPPDYEFRDWHAEWFLRVGEALSRDAQRAQDLEDPPKGLKDLLGFAGLALVDDEEGRHKDGVVMRTQTDACDPASGDGFILVFGGDDRIVLDSETLTVQLPEALGKFPKYCGTLIPQTRTRGGR